jgi:structural maintenance of chromosome 4
MISEKLHSAKPNLTVLEEYRKHFEDYIVKMEELEKATKGRDEAKNQYDELRQKRLDEFMKGFGIISQKLKEMYQVCLLYFRCTVYYIYQYSYVTQCGCALVLYEVIDNFR